MSDDYWLGVLTIPAVAVVGWVVGWIFVAALAALARRGFSISVRWHRGVDKIDEYTLRHDIWWERPFGPVFIGGWYREKLRYQQPAMARFGRWIGVGRPDGPCAIVFRTRDMGEVS